jgi:acyl-CoA synthetase (AMP-forming)/AMP-acid ligase II
VPGIHVKVIALEDRPLPTLHATHAVSPGEIGEIIVQGPVVTKAYDALPEATAAAKIPSTDGTLWHRMGDAGYLDAEGRLWFCGRKAERVETTKGTLHTEPCEQVFRSHPAVARCALIGLGPRGAQTPALVVQPTSKLTASRQRALAAELRALARQNPQTEAIAQFFFHPAFPVDVRHNAKIHRLKLATWATTAKGYRQP